MNINTKYHKDTDWLVQAVMSITPLYSIIGALLYVISNPYMYTRIVIMGISVIQSLFLMLCVMILSRISNRNAKAGLSMVMTLLYWVTIPVVMAIYVCLTCTFNGQAYMFTDMLADQSLAASYTATLSYKPSSLGILGLMLMLLPSLYILYKGLIKKEDDITTAA